MAVVPPRTADNNRKRVRCTSSYAPPILDVAVVSGSGVYALYIAGNDESDNTGIKVISALFNAFIYGLSASYGFKNVDKCRELKQFETENRHRRPRERPLPPEDAELNAAPAPTRPPAPEQDGPEIDLAPSASSPPGDASPTSPDAGP
jgi:hypothetical protein